jgi:hypothetical protein
MRDALRLCVGADEAERMFERQIASLASLQHKVHAYSDAKVASCRGFRGFGREMSSRGRYAKPADFPLHAGSLYRGATRTASGFVHLVQGTSSVAPCRTLTRADGKQLCCRPGPTVKTALAGSAASAGETLAIYPIQAFPKPAVEPRPLPQKPSQQPLT